MRKAYIIAKELATEQNDIFLIKLNEEKLSQLEEAWSLKQKANTQQETLIDKNIH